MPLEIQHIDCLRVAGTAGLGLVAGMALGVSSLTVPALGAALSPSERLRVWSRLYDRGKAQLPVGTVLAALALAAAAALTDPEADLGLLALHRRALLGAAAATALSIVPFTFAVMMPGIRRLKEIEKQTLPDSLAAGKESDATIARWNGQHAVRAGLLGVAFLFSLTELVLAALFIVASSLCNGQDFCTSVDLLRGRMPEAHSSLGITQWGTFQSR